MSLATPPSTRGRPWPTAVANGRPASRSCQANSITKHQTTSMETSTGPARLAAVRSACRSCDGRFTRTPGGPDSRPASRDRGFSPAEIPIRPAVTTPFPHTRRLRGSLPHGADELRAPTGDSCRCVPCFAGAHARCSAFVWPDSRTNFASPRRRDAPGARDRDRFRAVVLDSTELRWHTRAPWKPSRASRARRVGPRAGPHAAKPKLAFPPVASRRRAPIRGCTIHTRLDTGELCRRSSSRESRCAFRTAPAHPSTHDGRADHGAAQTDIRTRED
jgi:hypothetical protein